MLPARLFATFSVIVGMFLCGSASAASMTLIDDGFTDNDGSITNNFPANDPVEATWTFPYSDANAVVGEIKNQQLEMPVTGNGALGTAQNSATLANDGDKIIYSGSIDLSDVTTSNLKSADDALRFGLLDSSGTGYVALLGVGDGKAGRFQVRDSPTLSGSFTNPSVSSDFNITATATSFEFSIERISTSEVKLIFSPGDGSGFSATIDHDTLTVFDTPIFEFNSVLYGDADDGNTNFDPVIVDDVQLVFEPIPEPASLILALVGSVLLVKRGRAHRR